MSPPTVSGRITNYYKPDVKQDGNKRTIVVSDKLKSQGRMFSSNNNTAEHTLSQKLSIFSLNDRKRKPPKIADDSDEEEEVSDRILRKRKPANLKVLIELESDGEDIDMNTKDDEDEEGQKETSKKRKVIHNDDDDDDEDDAYVDQNEENDRLLNDQSKEDKINKLLDRYKDRTREEIIEVLESTNYQFLQAMIKLANDTSSRKGMKRLKSRSDYDEDDADGLKKARARDEIEQDINNTAAVRFFNTATSQEIQEVTGCRPDAAEKLVNELRPFINLEDLKGRLKSEKGVSATFIESYNNMQSGYSATDRIIEKIEHIGSNLGRILDVWKGEIASAVSSRQGSPDSDGAEDEKAGTHITTLCQDVSTIDRTSALYHDAMDGYITAQPSYVNPEMTLKDYQIMGVNWMLLLYRKKISGILADEMGLGKTAQVISFLARLYELGNEGLHLIVVPSSTLENWVREFNRFAPKLQVRTYHGSQSERTSLQVDLLEDYDDYQVLVTTYNMATSNQNDRNFLRKLRCQTMILDEGHMVKNCFSARYQHLKKIKAPFRLLLTGTPLQNSLQELISLLTFIMPETFDQFQNELHYIFKVKNTYSKEESGKRDSTTTASQMLSRKRIQRAKQMMTPFVLRRRKLDVLKDLPQKFHVSEYCTMTHEQQKIYHTIVRDSRKTFEESEDGQKQTVKKTDMEAQYSSMSNILVHLRKAADHPMLFRNLYSDEKIKVMAKEIMKDVRYWDSEEQYIYEDMTIMSDFELNRLCLDHKVIKHHVLDQKAFMDSGKVKKLCELLNKYKNNKVLIFSQFTKMLDILEVVMKQIDTSYLRLDGETKVMERQGLIDQFNEDKDIPVLLLSTKAGGFGINLTSANIVILFDMDFNPQNDKQAEDRAHRVGQTQDVTIIRLISKNSIEEYILKLADIKLRLDKRISGNDEDENMDDTENEKKNLRQILQNEFKNVE